MIDENFREMDSADSLYDSFSDSTTSCSEVDSGVALVPEAYKYGEEFVFEVVRFEADV